MAGPINGKEIIRPKILHICWQLEWGPGAPLLDMQVFLHWCRGYNMRRPPEVAKFSVFSLNDRQARLWLNSFVEK